MTDRQDTAFPVTAIQEIDMLKIIKTFARSATVALTALTALAASNAYADEFRRLSVEQKPFHALYAQQSGIEIETWIDSPDGTYRPGDTLELAIRLSEDAHVRVFNIDADGQATLIYPNALVQDTLLTAGRVHRIPGPRADYMFRVSPPYGLNLLQVVATTDDRDFIAGVPYTQSGPFRELDWKGSRLARHLQVVANSQAADWAFSEQVFEVLPHGRKAQAFPSLPMPQGNFDFRIRLDDGTYKMGEPLNLTVYSEEHCRLTLFSYDQDGNWVLISPNGWGPERIWLQPGVTRVPSDIGHGGLWTGAQSSGVIRLLGLCTADEDVLDPYYDFYLVREYMQYVANYDQRRHRNIEETIVRLFDRYVAFVDFAWATADFEITVD